MGYDHVIFDKDGVLLDSSTEDLEWMEEMRIKEAESIGKEITWEQAEKVFKAKTQEDLEQLLDETGLTREELRRIEKAVAEKKVEKIKSGELNLFDDVVEVLESIEADKSVVSNAPRQATEFVLEKFDIRSHFQQIKSPGLDDIGRYIELRKPNPEMIKKVLHETQAENPIMVGDSTDDIRAARKAGIPSIHVRTNGRVEEEPDYQVEELREIVEIIKVR
ncbi:MAG: HAD family hydrolase [Candidatus Nanohaloarchaea archaeon]